MQRVDERALLLWLAPGLLGVFLSALACGAIETECDPADASCQELDPATARALSVARAQLLGGWEIDHTYTARNDADRPLLAAKAGWALEILEVSPPPEYGDQDRFTWRGALAPRALCVVSQEAFLAREERCDDFSPLTMGRCTGHTCTSSVEVEVQGYFLLSTGELGIQEQAAGDLFYLDEAQGLINLDVDIAGAVLLEGEQGQEATCERSCSWRTISRGLLEEAWPGYSGFERAQSFRRVREGARADRAVRAEPQTALIGDEAEIQRRVLGLWEVEWILTDKDAVERAFTFGALRYTLDVFELERAESNTGLWLLKGGLSPQSACLVPLDEVDAGTFACAEVSPLKPGRCAAEGCTEQGEQGVEGTYDAFSGELKLSQSDADAFYLEANRGYINLNLDLSLEGGALRGESVPATPCTSSCSWTVSGAGALAEPFPYRDGFERTLSLQRLR
jgi:hypothetical protein